MIAGERNLPESRISGANAVIGECALRTGNYALAEEAFRNMVKLSPDAFPVNQLATTLKKQGKSAEATGTLPAGGRPFRRFEAAGRAF